MADADSRLETVEDELKVLKGEVRRTLVDLRALLMRADSPMNEGSIGRRDALSDRDPEDQPQPDKTEVSQVIRQEPGTAPASAPATPTLVISPPSAPAPITMAPPIASPVGPGQPPGGMFPAGAPPDQAAADAAAHQDWTIAEQQQRLADQERRLAEQGNQMDQLSQMVQEGNQVSERSSGSEAEQQRKLDDQQRQIADQSRQMADMSRRMDDESRHTWDSRESDDEQNRRLEDQARLISEQNSRMADMDRKLEEQSKPGETVSDSPGDDKVSNEVVQNKEIEDLTREDPPPKVEEEGRSTRDAAPPVGKPSEPPVRVRPEVSPIQRGSNEPKYDTQNASPEPYINDLDDGSLDDAFDEYQENIEPPRRPAVRREENTSRVRDRGAVGGRGVEGLSGKEPRSAKARPDGPKSARPVRTEGSKIVRNRRWESIHDDREGPYRIEGGSHVYDEYQQLFDVTGDTGGPEDISGISAPLDVNLLASLVRWTSLAKGRVGEARLKRILDLYLGSGRSSPQLRELLTSVSSMVDTVPPETPQAAQECMDLLSHLHGILTGGLQIAQVPQISSSE